MKQKLILSNDLLVLQMLYWIMDIHVVAYFRKWSLLMIFFDVIDLFVTSLHGDERVSQIAFVDEIVDISVSICS
jgi:hypothetical protein